MAGIIAIPECQGAPEVLRHAFIARCYPKENVAPGLMVTCKSGDSTLSRLFKQLVNPVPVDFAFASQTGCDLAGVDQELQLRPSLDQQKVECPTPARIGFGSHQPRETFDVQSNDLFAAVIH